MAKIYRLSGHYDAASTSRERDWFWSALVADEDALFDLGTRRTVIARIRLECRNNPWLKAFVGAFPAMIGQTNLRSITDDPAYNAIKELWWARWCTYAEPTGLTWSEVEKIVWWELLRAGEVFFVLLANGQIQLVPSEYCDHIDYNTVGRPVKYHFAKRDPERGYLIDDFVVVDAHNVIHVYEQDSCQLGRGIPWLIASLIPARDVWEVDKAKTKAIKDSNQIFGTIETAATAPTNAPFTGWASAANPTEPASGAAPADAPAEAETDRVVDLKNGSVIQLAAGESLKLQRPEYQSTDHKDFITNKLHAIGTPLGVPLELWYTGIGDTSFSGYKGIGTQWDGRRKEWARWLERALLDKIHFWRASKAIKEGDLPPAPQGKVDAINWGWRRTSVLDAEREAAAASKRIQCGISDVATELEQGGVFARDAFTVRRQTYLQLLEASTGKAVSPDTEVPMSYLLTGTLPTTSPASKTP